MKILTDFCKINVSDVCSISSYTVVQEYTTSYMMLVGVTN
jgi:hypothetical protein